MMTIQNLLRNIFLRHTDEPLWAKREEILVYVKL